MVIWKLFESLVVKIILEASFQYLIFEMKRSALSNLSDMEFEKAD